MRVHLLHGIHTHAGPSSPVERLIPFLQAQGFEVCYPDYGFILGVQTRIVNPIVCGTLEPYVAPGDVLIGHSNGCAISYDLMNMGAKVAGAVFVNAALKQSIVRPPGVKFVDVYFNPGDDITEAAKVAAELGISDAVWGEMGHAGYSGPDTAIVNINCAATPSMPVVCGHSAFFELGHLAAWGPYLAKRLAGLVT